NLDIRHAQEVLDRDHFGLLEIKDRILEHLAVHILQHNRRQRVLVVDDEEKACRALGHVLRKEGYEVYEARSGERALELLAQVRFDLVLTDLKMGQVDGLQVLEAAKKIDPATEVIVISGYASVSAAVDAMQKGSSQVLNKPLQLEEIRKIVAKAVSKKKKQLDLHGPILCFVGPPGTGKTSLGVSIAGSLERKFIRISLAGVNDEAQLRGHRRSYVGSLPGRIIQEIKRVQTRNPVFMLDEIDKLGQEFKGDPAAALLEILDPEQNRYFSDHYLEVPFDLSRVMFIATANTTDSIPPPLLDRLEIIRLSGYTREEKERIVFDYLLPKEKKNASLQDYDIELTPEAVQKLIRGYTREAGLRNLQRQVASICRKTARNILQEEKDRQNTISITPAKVEAMLGPELYYFEVPQAKDRIGVATGLAWTQFGGEILFVEATKMKGSGKLILTGSLGEILKESAQAALSYLRSNTEWFGLADDFSSRQDIHVHVPAGAIPKDGPSAGLTIAVALLSLLTERPCRRDLACSGELTLSGRILPVSGIREKLLAARNSGVTTVVFPAKNKADLQKIPAYVTRDLKLLFVQELLEIRDEALLPVSET
ncbi:MAG: endopeptidase La, partial [Desulfohalobiaceae bacterium]|nr:endopeptidase La [Desulfohalobiaceae bacterium]